MRADKCASVALDTFFSVPYRNVHCYATLLVGGCAGWHGAVLVRKECAYRKSISALGVDHVSDFFYEWSGKTLCVVIDEFGVDRGPFCRNLDFYVLSSAIDSCVVHIDDVLALLAVRLESRILHVLDSILYRNNTGDAEECTLKNGVGASAKAYFGSNLGSVDDIKLDLLASDDGFDEIRDSFECLLFVPQGVEKKAASFLYSFEDIIFLKI